MSAFGHSIPPPWLERKGLAYSLAVAALVVSGGGFWLARGLENRREAVNERMQEWTKAVDLSAELGGTLVEIYAAGLQPPDFGDTEMLSGIRKNYERRFSAVAARLRNLSGSDTSSRVFADLDRVQTGAEEMLGTVDTLRSLSPRRPSLPLSGAPLGDGIRALDRRYEEARTALQDLEQEERRQADSLEAESLELGRKPRQAAYGAATLLGLLFAAAAAALLRRESRARQAEEERRRLEEERDEADERYRQIFDNAVEGIFQTTPAGGFLTANRALARMFGYNSPEHLMSAVTDAAAQLYAEPAQRRAMLDALRTRDEMTNLEFEVVRADGRLMWVRENVRAVRDERGELLYIEGTVGDVSDAWWGEQRRRLQYALARILAEAPTVDLVRPQILGVIGKALGWEVGMFWDAREDGMHVQEIWGRPGLDIELLETAFSHASVQRGETLVGEAWLTGEPAWIENLAAQPGEGNAEFLLGCGLSAALVAPVRINGHVQHILEFFSPQITLPDQELRHTLGSICGELGHLIERKRAEEALRKSEMRKAAILRSALDCIVTFDLEGRITEFNPAAERAFGYTQQDALGREMAELVIPESLRENDRPGFALYNASKLGAMPGRRVEMTAVRADGSEFPVEMSVTRILIDARPMFTAYMRDITERQAAERITAEMAAVVTHSNDAIITCTLEGKIVNWNVGAERIYGYAAEEVVGGALDRLIPLDRLDELPQALHTVKLGKSLANYETVRLRKDGKRISVSLTDSPIRGEGGRVTGLSSIARDITERKKLEEDLLQSQKMDAVGRLAGGIAHDFNNILTAILGYSDLIIGQIDERQWMHKHLVEIRKAADFAASLTHQLLAFSRRQPLFLRVFSINETVNNLHKMLRRVIGEDIEIRTQLKAKIGRLKADPSQLEQVLLNLCVNARDAMPKGGAIAIETDDVTYFVDELYSVDGMPAGEYVKLTISDTGTGMTAEVKKHIFEPFFTTKETGQGTGLGLATCYGIVKQSGGYITVDSQPGKGTTFFIYLPRVDESGEKSTTRTEVGRLPGGSETVLYVEDEITVRSLTANVLRRLGYTVLEAGSGKQARDAMENHHGGEVDLLFSDVVLPDAGGKELADWVRATRQGRTKFLFTSGYVDEGILRRHGLERDTPFLQKPFTPADLARKVREVLDDSNGGANGVEMQGSHRGD